MYDDATIDTAHCHVYWNTTFVVFTIVILFEEELHSRTNRMLSFKPTAGGCFSLITITMISSERRRKWRENVQNGGIPIQFMSELNHSLHFGRYLRYIRDNVIITNVYYDLIFVRNITKIRGSTTRELMISWIILIPRRIYCVINDITQWWERCSLKWLWNNTEHHNEKDKLRNLQKQTIEQNVRFSKCTKYSIIHLIHLIEINWSLSPLSFYRNFHLTLVTSTSLHFRFLPSWKSCSREYS